MTRRSVRVTLICLGLLLTAGLGYRVFDDEQRLTAERNQLSSLDHSIDDVLRTLSDVRGSLHAYVAPGQRSSVWEARSAALFDKLRQQLIALDAAAAPSGRSLNESLDNLDQLTAAEKRVRHYLDFSQPLLAGDVIFTEVRDLVDATAQQVSGVRDVVRQDSNGRLQQTRREQATLVLSGVVFWVASTLLLAFVVNGDKARTQGGSAIEAPAGPGLTSTGPFDLALAPGGVVAVATEPPPPPAIVENPHDREELARWKRVARICAEISAVKELKALSGSLSQACEALGAKDAIVWVASPDGTRLEPHASYGFDARVLARIGAISRDSANLTAAAFRDGQPRQSAATPSSPGALAIALRGPSGPTGVFSAELQSSQDVVDAMELAIIFAGQIAPLASGTDLPVVTEMPQRRQAQA